MKSALNWLLRAGLHSFTWAWKTNSNKGLKSLAKVMRASKSDCEANIQTKVPDIRVRG